MQVSRVAYDRFELQLPPADPGAAPLADSRVARDVACWLWQFGPTPLVAIVEHDGTVPAWLSRRLTLGVPWQGRTAAALLLEERDDLERFLLQGAPHERTHILWPRVSPAKTFEALCAGGDAWENAVEGHARVSDPEVIEVFQLQPV
jgi:hypothetical protein